MTRFVLVLALSAALAAPAVAHAIAPAEALRLLERAARGERDPGDLVEAPGLSDGCASHGAYIALNGGTLVQGEDPSKPGYTPAGDRQTLDASGPQALSSDPRWSDAANPWSLSPIDLFRIFDPEVAVAGYGDDGVVACLRVRGGRAPASAPELYSLPGNGRTGVPMSELSRASPYSPQQLVGIPAEQTTGPNLLLFTRGLRGSQPLSAPAYSLTGPGGPVEARLVTEGTASDAGSGAWFRGGGVLIPVAPLAPFATYVARVTWHRDAEGELPAADVEQVVSFETAGLPNTIDVIVSSHGARNVIRVATPAPNPSLKLTGPRQLTDIPRLRAGVARYDELARGAGRRARSPAAGRSATFPASICKPFTAAARVQLALAARPRPQVGRADGAADRRRAPRAGHDLALQAAVRAARREGARRSARGSRSAARRGARSRSTRRSRASRCRPAGTASRSAPAWCCGAFGVGEAPYLATEIRRTWE